MAEASARRAPLHLALALLALAAPALSAPAAQAQTNTESAAAALRLCATHFPDTRRMVDAFKKDGWRYEGADGTYHYYSLDGRRVIVGTTVTSATDTACIVGVSRLTPEGALGLAEGFVNGTKGFKRLSGPPPQGVLGIWQGSVNGITVNLGALPPEDFQIMRGAAVVLIRH